MASAQDTTVMMDKGQSGVPLASAIDRSLCSQEDAAVDGYDVISYRENGGPVPGTPDFSAEHDGSTYYFSSQSHLATFIENPERYIPAYHGFCAVTLALGRVVCPDSTNFVIQDDRLFLFEVTGFTNGRTLWSTDPEDFRARADTNFESLVIE